MKFTVREVLDNIEKNGYPWTKGDFYDLNGASCAFGQAVRNFGFNPELTYKVKRISFKEKEPQRADFQSLCWAIYDSMYDAIHKKFPEYTARVPGIVSMNDAFSTDTYEDVVKRIKNNFPPETLDIVFEVDIEGVA